MPIKLTYECPHCGHEMYGGPGDEVRCDSCRITFDTEYDHDTENWDGWLTNEHPDKTCPRCNQTQIHYESQCCFGCARMI